MQRNPTKPPIDFVFVYAVDDVSAPHTGGAVVHELSTLGTLEAVGRFMAVWFLNRSVGRIIHADMEQEIRRQTGNDRFTLADPTPQAVEEWVRDDARRTDPKALRGGKRALRRHATRMTRRNPKVLLGMVCDGARLPAEVLEHVDRLTFGQLESFSAKIDTARVMLKAMADRCPGLEDELRRIEYRREDGPKRTEGAREAKAAEDAYREEWVVSRYLEVRPNHAPGRFGNTPAMQEVSAAWGRSAPGRSVAWETVRNILKRRGIDPAFPVTGATPARRADFE